MRPIERTRTVSSSVLCGLLGFVVLLGCGGVLGPTEPLSGVWRLHREEDVTQVSFDRIDLDECVLVYEGTGGTDVRRWRDGQCSQRGETLQITGQWLGSCFGMEAHPPWCDPMDESDNEAVSMTLEVQRIDDCTIQLSGTRYVAVDCS